MNFRIDFTLSSYNDTDGLLMLWFESPKGDEGEDDIKMGYGVDWIHLAEKRKWWRGLVNTAMNLPKKVCPSWS